MCDGEEGLDRFGPEWDCIGCEKSPDADPKGPL